MATTFTLTATQVFQEGADVGAYPAELWGGRAPIGPPPGGATASESHSMGATGVTFTTLDATKDWYAAGVGGDGDWWWFRIRPDQPLEAAVSGVTEEELEEERQARITGDATTAADASTALGAATATLAASVAAEAATRAGSVDAEVTARSAADTAEAAARAAHEALADTAHTGIMLKSRWELNVEDYGVLPTSKGGTGPANDTAIAALLASISSRGILKFAAGDYPFSDQIIPDGSKKIAFEGQGMGVSRLVWATDLGAGKYGIKANSTIQIHRVYRKLSLVGPQGAAPADATAVLTADFVLGTDTTMHLADTSTLDAAPSRVGMVGRTKKVFYTGKTGTTLTGCTSTATPATYPSGGTVTQKRDMGYQPASMDGMRWGGYICLEDVEIFGFRYGAVSVGDHNYMTRCKLGDNYAGVFYANTTATGDQAYKECLFSGNRLAGVAMDSGLVSGAQATIGGTVFLGCHFGFGPYAFYKAANDATAPAWMFNVTLLDCAFEQIGNGVIYDASGDAGATIDGLLCLNCTSNSPMEYDAYAIWGNPGDYMIQTGQIKKMQVLGEDWLVPGKLAVIRTLTASGLTQFYQLSSELLSSLQTKQLPFATGTPSGCMMENTNGGRVILVKTLNAVTQYDLVQQATSGTNADTVELANGGVIVGVALQGCTVAQVIPVMTIGRTKIRNVGSITQASYLKPDGTTKNKVATSTGWSDGPLVGHSTLASSGDTVDARVNFGY